MKVLVVQKGSREHYAVAQALYQQGMLAGLFTDWYAFEDASSRGALSVAVALSRFWGKRNRRAALAARCEAIPDELVRAFPLRSLYWKWRERRGLSRGLSVEAFVETDRAFAATITRHPLPAHDVFFGYSYASLEMLQYEKERGVFTVLDQIDPGPVEYRLVAEEMTRHPELSGMPAPFPKEHFARARREWDLTDMIVVNSEWSREAIIAEGAAPEKIEVIPLCYEKRIESTNAESRTRKMGEPLRVLFLGQVNVRKGIHNLIEAARQLTKEPVEFLIVGQSDIRNEAMAKAPQNMRWMGAAPRSQVPEYYRKSDVFVLPTLSDGYAITQLEAMAYGLPVIVTPNCGRVVEDGVTGFIVPASDPGALVSVIRRLIGNPALLGRMHGQCTAAVDRYSVESYGRRLTQAIRLRMGTRTNGHRPGGAAVLKS